MSNIQMGSYTVGIFLVTLLTTVHSDVIGRTRKPQQGLTPTALSASAFNDLTCRSWGKCCEVGDVNCGPQKGQIYCNCDVTCHAYFDCCRDYDEFCTGLGLGFGRWKQKEGGNSRDPSLVLTRVVTNSDIPTDEPSLVPINVETTSDIPIQDPSVELTNVETTSDISAVEPSIVFPRRECDADYTNIRGKCICSAGLNTYYYARKICEDDGATIVMPTTELAWRNFIDSSYIKDIIGSDPSFQFWLNCRVVNDAWYWQTGGSPGTLVGWNNFDSSLDFVQKKSGLVGTGSLSGTWGVSKQWESKYTFCEK